MYICAGTFKCHHANKIFDQNDGYAKWSDETTDCPEKLTSQWMRLNNFQREDQMGKGRFRGGKALLECEDGMKTPLHKRCEWNGLPQIKQPTAEQCSAVLREGEERDAGFPTSSCQMRGCNPCPEDGADMVNSDGDPCPDWAYNFGGGGGPASWCCADPSTCGQPEPTEADWLAN